MGGGRRRNWGGVGRWKRMRDGEEENESKDREGKMLEERAEHEGDEVGRRKRMKRVGRKKRNSVGEVGVGGHIYSTD